MKRWFQKKPAKLQLHTQPLPHHPRSTLCERKPRRLGCELWRHCDAAEPTRDSLLQGWGNQCLQSASNDLNSVWVVLNLLSSAMEWKYSPTAGKTEASPLNLNARSYLPRSSPQNSSLSHDWVQRGCSVAPVSNSRCSLLNLRFHPSPVHFLSTSPWPRGLEQSHLRPLLPISPQAPCPAI